MTASTDPVIGLLTRVACAGLAAASWLVAPSVGPVAPIGAAETVFTTADPQGPSALTGAALARPVEQLRPEVLTEIPHESAAFTQGLDVSEDGLYEGTGLWGRSQLRELDPVTGAVRRAVPLPDTVFGQGIAVVDDRVWQLDWTRNVALEWRRDTFTLLGTVSFTGSGRGLCYDGTVLVRSDGSDRLRFHDADTFGELGSVAVTQNGRPLKRLGELECRNGQLWASVWQSDRIVRIDPADGRVTAVVDAAELLAADARIGADVLDAIAVLDDGSFLLTGTLWPMALRVRFVAAPAAPVIEVGPLGVNRTTSPARVRRRAPDTGGHR